MNPRKEYFGFALNEYQYRRVAFSRHFSQEAAERAHYHPFRHEEDSHRNDLSTTVIEGRAEFEKWAEECEYEIDWENKILIYKGK